MRFTDPLIPPADAGASVIGSMRDVLGSLIDNIADLERLKTALDANQAELIEQARQWARVIEVTAGSPDSSGWNAEVRSRRVIVSEIAAALRIPERTSENLVAESSELVTGLPDTFRALAEGAISRRHVSRLIDHARSLPDAALAAFEEAVLSHARRLTVAQFDRKARQVRERTHPESIDARQRDAFERRAVTLEHDRDGLSAFYVPVPAAKAQAIFNRLTDMAETQRRFELERQDRMDAGEVGAAEGIPSSADATSAASPRTIDQLRADLFVQLLLDGQVIPEDGQEHADLSGIRATVLITVPALTFLGRSDEPATLEGYGPIDYDTALDLAAAAPSFIRILTHPETGTVLSVGRDRYRPPADLKTWLRVSDVTCRFPRMQSCRSQLRSRSHPRLAVRGTNSARQSRAPVPLASSSETPHGLDRRTTPWARPAMDFAHRPCVYDRTGALDLGRVSNRAAGREVLRISFSSTVYPRSQARSALGSRNASHFP